MADSELSIRISAEADNALSKLDKIVDSLSRIENVLNGVFEPLKRIEGALSGISGTTINIKVDTKQVDNAAKKIKKVKELTGATFEAGGSGAHQRGFQSDVIDEATKGYMDSMGKIQDDLGKNLPAISNQFTELGEVISQVNEETKEFEATSAELRSATDGLGGVFRKEYNEIQDAIQEALIKKKEFSAVQREIEKSPESAYEREKYAEAIVGANDATETIKKYKEQLIAVDKALKSIESFTPTNNAQYEQIKELVSEYQELITKRKEYQALNKQINDTPTLFSGEQVADAIAGLNSVEQRMAEIRQRIIDAAQSLQGIEMKDLGVEVPDVPAEPFEEIAESAVEARDAIQELVHQINEYENIIKGFRNEDSGISTEQYNEALEKLPALKEQLKAYEESIRNASRGLDTQQLDQSTEHAKSKIEELIEKIREYKETIRGMESGKIEFNENAYTEAVRGLPAAEEALKRFKGVAHEATKKTTPNNKGVNAWRALATAVNTATRSMSALGDAGLRAAQAVIKPFANIGSKLKAQLGNAGKAFEGFRKTAVKAISKITFMWQKFITTFTRVLFYKAISQIVKGINEAIESLAKFSNAMGTDFNNSMSNLIADFNVLARSIVAIFEPIINKVVPILDMIANKVAVVSNVIAQFFAALGGQGYAMMAKKRVDNYAESLDKASKKAKNLKQNLLGIDELNVINDKKDDEDDTSYMDEWEITPIDPKILDFANKIRDAFEDLIKWLKDNFGDLWHELFDGFDLKKLVKDLFQPILDAWEATKKRLGESFVHMISSLARLWKDMFDDFMDVWKEENTKKIFENIFNAIADIMDAIGYLADRFREAWNENDTGKKILQDIRDIVLIITEWVAKAAKYFKEWAKNINFKPLLTSFEKLLRSLKKIVNFIMAELYDIFTIVVLGWAKYLIEEGIPLLNEQFAKIADGFPADKVRANLLKIWKAIEKLGEEIFKGVALAIGDIGDMFNKFLDSKRFEDFVNTIAAVMSKLDSEDVRKIIDAIAVAIGDLATALVDFVNSKEFMDFIDRLDQWIGNASTQEIADILKKIAIAIALFKFAGFVGPGVAAFLTFVGALKSLAPLEGIANTLSGIASAFGGLGTAVAGLDALAASLLGIIGVVFAGGFVAAAAALIASGGNIEKAIKIVNDAIAKVGKIDFKKIADDLASGLAKMLNDVFAVMEKMNWKEIWDIILDLLLAFVSGVATLIHDLDWSAVTNALVQCASQLVLSLFGHLPAILAVVGQLIAAVITAVIEMLAGYFKAVAADIRLIGIDIIAGIFEGMANAIAGVAKWIDEHIFQPIINAFKTLFGIHSPSTVMAEIGVFVMQGFLQGILEMVSTIIDAIKGFIETVISTFQSAREAIEGVWNGLSEFFATIWANITSAFTTAWETIYGVWSLVAEWFNTAVIIPIQDYFSGMWTAITQWFFDAYNSIITWWGGVAQWFLETVIIPTQNFFSGMWGIIVEYFQQARETAIALWEMIAGWFETNVVIPIHNAFKTMWEAVVGFFEWAVNAAKDLWLGIKEWFVENIIQPLQDAWDTAWQAIQDFFQRAADKAQEIWQIMSDWFNNEVVEPIRRWFEEKLALLKDYFQDAKDNAIRIWEEVEGWFFKNVVEPIRDYFDKLKDKVIEYFGKAKDEVIKIWESVKAWFEGLVNKLKEIFDEGLKAIKQYFEDRLEDIKKIWLAGKEWFENTIIKPLQDAFTACTKAIGDAFTALWSAIQSGASVAFNMVASAASAALNGVISLINGVISGLNQVIMLANKLGAKLPEIPELASVEIPQFATGGFPENGLFFANSTELVGKFTNGHTAVANNDQIVQGIAAGVEQAITGTLAGYLGEIEANQKAQMQQRTSITLDGRELVGALDSRKSRNGFSFT